MLHVCSCPGLNPGTQSPHQSYNWKLQSFCSRLGWLPIGFGPAYLVKTLCKRVQLMIQLNMIKKNKSQPICTLHPPSHCLSVKIRTKIKICCMNKKVSVNHPKVKKPLITLQVQMFKWLDTELQYKALLLSSAEKVFFFTRLRSYILF